MIVIKKTRAMCLALCVYAMPSRHHATPKIKKRHAIAIYYYTHAIIVKITTHFYRGGSAIFKLFCKKLLTI